MSKKPKQLDLFIPEAEDLPPFTNRGVTVSIHWLSITFFSDIKNPMTHLLREFFGYDIEDVFDWSEHFFATNHGARGYRALYFGPENIRLYGYPDTGKHCHLEIPGKVIELYGNQKTLDYLKSLKVQEFEWRCTRIDIAFDHVPFTPKDCYDAWQRGDVIAKCHNDSWDWRENAEGNTLYIGSRKSERFIRIYDRRGFTRLELVFKNNWAENFARVITEISPEEWIIQCVGYLRDYVNFISRNSNKPKDSDFKLLPWWDSFVGNSEKIHLDMASKNPNEELKRRLENYLVRMLPTLYVIRHGLDKDINKIVDVSEYLLNKKHIEKLKILQSVR